MQSHKMQDNHPIIFFDGVCNLCNSAVMWVIRNDKKDVFRFAPLQSVSVRVLLKDENINLDNLTSIVLLEDGKVYKRSTAGLRIAKRLGGWVSLMYVFILVPPFLRDGVYNFIARNRYRWFGKRQACMVPTPELRKKFLEQT